MVRPANNSGALSPDWFAPIASAPAPSAFAKFPKNSLRSSALRFVATRALFCAGAKADAPSMMEMATRADTMIFGDILVLFMNHFWWVLFSIEGGSVIAMIGRQQSWMKKKKIFSLRRTTTKNNNTPACLKISYKYVPVHSVTISYHSLFSYA